MVFLNSLKSNSSVKLFAKFFLWGITLFFIAQTLIANWPAVRAINLTVQSWRWLALAWALSLAAHCWTGWVWHWLLQAWGLPLGGLWAMRVYLFTNVAKYLPGNIWHFYGRVRAVQKAGGPLGKALASVIAEPLVMAVAAVGLGALASACFYLIDVHRAVNRVGSGLLWTLGLLGLWGVALLLLHPRWLNPRLAQMSRLKLIKLKQNQKIASLVPTLTFRHQGDRSAAFVSNANEGLLPESRASEPEITVLKLRHYPWLPLLGEIGFVLGRSLGFIATVMAITPLSPTDIPLLISTFSVAWLLGLVVPGAPGGIGVFEASAIVLLGAQFPQGIILGSVACYRLVSTLAELVGATVVWLYEQIKGLGGDFP